MMTLCTPAMASRGGPVSLIFRSVASVPHTSTLYSSVALSRYVRQQERLLALTWSIAPASSITVTAASGASSCAVLDMVVTVVAVVFSLMPSHGHGLHRLPLHGYAVATDHVLHPDITGPLEPRLPLRLIPEDLLHGCRSFVHVQLAVSQAATA